MAIQAAPIPIIILNWNGLSDTRECLAALEQQSSQHYHIYLVDNGSAPDEAARIRQLYDAHPKITLVCNTQNLGFTLGNNAVLKELLARDEVPPFVVLLNNDTAPSPQWLEALLAAATDGADMVASKMVNYFARSHMDNAGHQLLNTLEILPIGNDEPVNTYFTAFENVGPCAGAALYRTAMLQDIGIFDEQFRNGYEDVELGLRGIVTGYRAVFAPEAVVYHKVSRSVNKIRDFAYTLSIQKHIYYIIAKLIPTGALIACLPFLFLRTFAALLLNLFFGRWKFLRIQLLALTWVFGSGRKSLITARHNFLRTHKTISSPQLLKKMDFFLKKDLQRFHKYLLRGEKMVFEKYE